jgi:predicted AAA+ superfamily ATPase
MTKITFLERTHKYKDKIKMIVSGSLAFYPDTKFEDSLAGRKRIFQVYPLSFSDLPAFKDEQDLYNLPLLLPLFFCDPIPDIFV